MQINQKYIYKALGILTMLGSYFLHATLNHSSDISNFIAVGLVGFIAVILGLFMAEEKLQKLSQKIITVNVMAAIVTIVIANAMGWVDTGEIIDKIGHFWV